MSAWHENSPKTSCPPAFLNREKKGSRRDRAIDASSTAQTWAVLIPSLREEEVLMDWRCCLREWKKSEKRKKKGKRRGGGGGCLPPDFTWSYEVALTCRKEPFSHLFRCVLPPPKLSQLTWKRSCTEKLQGHMIATDMVLPALGSRWDQGYVTLFFHLQKNFCH